MKLSTITVVEVQKRLLDIANVWHCGSTHLSECIVPTLPEALNTPLSLSILVCLHDA